MRNIFKNYFIGMMILLSIFSFAMPTQIALAEEKADKAFIKGESLVPCGSDTTEFSKDAKGRVTGGDVVNKCDFNYLFKLINKVVNFFFVALAVPIAAILFAYAGIMLIFSGGQSGKIEKAKSIFMSVAVGLILAGACWLIIHLILTILDYNGLWFGFE